MKHLLAYKSKYLIDHGIFVNLYRLIKQHSYIPKDENVGRVKYSCCGMHPSCNFDYNSKCCIKLCEECVIMFMINCNDDFIFITCLIFV